MRDNFEGHSFSKGDMVLVTQKKGNKLAPSFNPTPLWITDIKGSMNTPSKEEYSISRNASQCRKIGVEIVQPDDRDLSDDECIPPGEDSMSHPAGHPANENQQSDSISPSRSSREVL